MLDELLKTSVLLVCGDPTVSSTCQLQLAAAGYRVEVLDNPMLVAGAIRDDRPDVLLLDAELPAMPPATVVEALRRSDFLRSTRVVLLSAGSGTALASQVEVCGAEGVVSKSSADVAARLKSVLQRTQTITSASIFKRAVVIAEDAQVGRALEKSLNELGLTVSQRGPAGLGTVLRGGEVDVVLLDPSAFHDLARELERGRQAGLLAKVAIVSLGVTEEADAMLLEEPPYSRYQLKGAVIAALRAVRDRAQ